MAHFKEEGIYKCGETLSIILLNVLLWKMHKSNDFIICYLPLFVQELIAVIWSPKCGAINIFCRTWRKKFRQKIQKHLPSSIKRQLSKDSILFLGVGIFLRWVDEAKFRKFHRQKIIKTIFLLHYKNSWHFYYFFLLM